MELAMLDIQDTPQRRLHYEVVSQWWTERGLDPVPYEILPPTGAIVFGDRGTYRAAGWLYMDAPILGVSSGVCFFHHFVSNTRNTAEMTRRYGAALIGLLFDYAREMGYSRMITTTDSGTLAAEAETLGMAVNPHPMIQLSYAF